MTDARAAPFLPVFLDLNGARVVVVGGDAAAAAKAKAFANAGALVRIISSKPGAEALEMAPVVRITKRSWLYSDFTECDLICAGPALSDAVVERLAGAAEACGAQLYAIDRPSFSDFSSGASITRGPLAIGISTAGAAPAFGQAIRREIERLIPDAAASYIEAASAERAAVSAKLQGAERRRFWAETADAALAAMQENESPNTLKDWRKWIKARLSTKNQTSTTRILVIHAPQSNDELTLAQARALSRADIAFTGADAATACLSLLRREAERKPLPPSKDAASVYAMLPPGAFAVVLAGAKSLEAAKTLAALAG